MTSTISERALVQRINRKLAHEGERLRKTRPAVSAGMTRAQLDVGDYYVQDCNRNLLVATHVDPEELGRELGVLRAHEQVAA